MRSCTYNKGGMVYSADIKFDTLEQQLAMLPTVCNVGRGIKKVTTITTITDAITSVSTNEIAKSMLSEVEKLLRIYLTIPITTSTSERSFSGLRRLKTHLRSSMSQQRLNNIALPHVHKLRTDEIDLETIFSKFVNCNERRRKFFGNV